MKISSVKTEDNAIDEKTSSMYWNTSYRLTSRYARCNIIWASFWSFVKSVRKGSNNLVWLNVDGVTLSNDLSIVESMNDFFSSVFTSEDCDNFPEFEYVTNCKLSNILCNIKEVEELLKNLISTSRLDLTAYHLAFWRNVRVFCHHLCVFSFTNHFQQANCHIFRNSLTSHLCSKKAGRLTGMIIARSH